MAHSDKNILITPNIGSTTADPKIVFSGADASTGAQNITLQVYPTNSGTLSFEGSAGQLLSITNSMSGTIYSVNDISGIPSIEVLDTGLVKLAQYSGNVVLGTATDNGIDKLQVNGSISAATLKGTLKENIKDTTYAASVNLTELNGSIANLTLSGNVTFTDSVTSGCSVTLILLNGSSYAITWPTITWVGSGGNVAPTLTAKDILIFWKINTTLYGTRVGGFA